MSQPTDQDFEKDEENREDIVEVTEKIGEAIPEDKSLVVSEDVFPESLIIVPLYDRPLFPKMLLPVIISDEKLEKVLLEELKESITTHCLNAAEKIRINAIEIIKIGHKNNKKRPKQQKNKAA